MSTQGLVCLEKAAHEAGVRGRAYLEGNMKRERPGWDRVERGRATRGVSWRRSERTGWADLPISEGAGSRH